MSKSTFFTRCKRNQRESTKARNQEAREYNIRRLAAIEETRLALQAAGVDWYRAARLTAANLGKI